MKSNFNQLNNLQQRLVTGISGSALMITGICYSHWSYFLTFFLVLVFSLQEFYRLTAHDGLTPNRYWGAITGVVLFSLAYAVQKGSLSSDLYFLAIPMIFLVFAINLFSRSSKPFNDMAYTILGIVYIALPLALLNYAAFDEEHYRYWIVLGTVLLLWACDTGAYFVGRFFGKHPLFPRVSPKKTWEGSFGGLALALVIAAF